VKRDDVIEMMQHLGACGDALSWLRSLPPDTTPRQAWRFCPRGEWLLWWLERMGCDPHWTGAGACACVRGVWPLLADERSRCAVEVRERWNSGRASDEELAAARAAARAADGAAAWAAAWAADGAAARAAARAADGAAAWAAAWAAALVADGAAAHRKCARRVRRMIPWRIVRRTMREWRARGKGGER
jgi:hypothetical protein